MSKRSQLSGHLLCLTSLLAHPVLAQPGELDPSFGLNGLGSFGMAAPAEAAEAIAFQSDGSIILAGHTEAATDTTAWVARLLPITGLPDFTFGQGGVLAVDIGQGPERAFDVIVDAQDRILVTGFAFTDSLPHLFVRRLLPNGDVDTSFASFFGNGTYVDLMSQPSAAYSLVATPDGGAVAAGVLSNEAYRIRFDSTGVATYLGFGLSASGHGATVIRDQAFSGDSVLFAVGDGMLADRDMLLLTGGSAFFASAQFGQNGFQQLDLGEDEEGHAVAVDGQGRVLVAGHVGGNFTYDLLVARFLPDGTLDSTFGTNGIIREDLGQAFFLGKDLQVLDDGRILVLVNTATAGPTPIYLRAFMPDGTPDAGFGTNGTTIIEVFPVFANGRGLAVQDTCRALIAGLRGYPNDQNALVAAIQLDSCGMISTGLPTATPSGFQLYPNPSTGEVHIQLNGTGPGPREWEVLDLAGRVVLRGRFDGGHAVFRADVSPGTYAVRLRTGSEVRTHLLQLVR